MAHVPGGDPGLRLEDVDGEVLGVRGQLGLVDTRPRAVEHCRGVPSRA